MIGHVLNGYKVVAASPSTMSDYYVILGHAVDDRSDQWATALVHTSTMPTPREWWTGHYLRDGEEAAASYLDRITTMATTIPMVVLSYLESEVTWQHLDGTACRHEVSEEVPGLGFCIDEDRRVKRAVYP